MGPSNNYLFVYYNKLIKTVKSNGGRNYKRCVKSKRPIYKKIKGNIAFNATSLATNVGHGGIQSEITKKISL